MQKLALSVGVGNIQRFFSKNLHFCACVGNIYNYCPENTVLFNLSSPRPAKTVPFVILLCLMSDNFTH